MNNRVLIVDDNPDIHRDFRKILCPKGSSPEIDRTEEALFGKAVDASPILSYELTSAFQGIEAIELVRKSIQNREPFALAFVDVRMPPGIDGVETIKQVWAIDPDLEVVISTAYSDYSWDQLRERLQQADWLLILKKPFDNIEVLQLTKALTRKWKLERDTQMQLASLRRANALLEAQQETSIDGILVVDEHRKILAYNGRFLKLWGVPEAVTDTNDDNLLLASVASNLRDPLLFYERLDHLYDHPSESSRDEVNLTDGRVFDRYSTPILGDQGQNYGRIWYFRDITHERESENTLRKARDAADHANQAKSSFLANMSHEIRTPMTAILGYADLLAEEGSRGNLSADQRSDYVRTIKRNGEHLLALINDILDLSKVEAGKMAAELIDTHPDHIVKSVIALMQVNAQAKGIRLEAVFETPVPIKILSDPLRLRQILVNLIGNAIKFTELGAVRVCVGVDSTNPADPLLQFRIEDTGVGMTVEQTSRLFGAFEQADASTTRLFGGTGLGLRISKRLAEILGGDIAVTSTKGKGSTFTLTLHPGSLAGVELIDPATATRAGTASAPAPAAPTDQTLTGVRILLAEDGPDNQRLIAFHLRRAGAEVEVVENGELAVKALTVDGSLDASLSDAPRCDLVLMDMQMPKMDGYSATRLLRDKGSKLPILALTARTMIGDADECLRAGCNAYAPKPIDSRDLIALCVKWVRQSRGESDSAPAKPESKDALLASEFAADPAMLPLIHEFTRQLPDTADKLEKFWANRELDELKKWAHQLNGSAGMYGYPTITRAARHLELALIQKEEEQARVCTLELITLCRRASARGR